MQRGTATSHVFTQLCSWATLETQAPLLPSEVLLEQTLPFGADLYVWDTQMYSKRESFVNLSLLGDIFLFCKYIVYYRR